MPRRDSDASSSVGSLIESDSEPDVTTFKCLFCDKPWGNVPNMFTHCEKEHGYNVRDAAKSIGSKLEEIGIIKLVNYLRLEAQKGTDPSTLSVTAEALADDKYLAPALEDDPLLFELGDFMPDPDEQVRTYEDFEAVLSKQLPEDISKIDISGDRDELYFASYKENNIHQEMIKDRVRTESYRDFIEKYSHLIKDKIVLDVGCGTSILSLFCARAGAKKVFAVDNSDIAQRAREIVKKNGFENIVEVIQGKVEDFHLRSRIGQGIVDIIVSEWMGYGLLFEGMLDSVLKARDIYLKPGGLLIPSHCTLRIAPISDADWVSETTGKKFWSDVYGFDFSPMIPGGELNDKEIGVFDVPPNAIAGQASTFYQLDLAKITVPELDFTAGFSSVLTRDIKSLDGFAIWFDNYYLPHDSNPDLHNTDALEWARGGQEGVTMTTSPFGEATHWHQAVLLLDEKQREAVMEKGAVLEGKVTYKKQRRDVRGIDVAITWMVNGVEQKVARVMA